MTSNAINDTLMNEELLTCVSIFFFLFLFLFLNDNANIIKHVEIKDLLAVQRVCKYFFSLSAKFYDTLLYPLSFIFFFCRFSLKILVIE